MKTLNSLFILSALTLGTNAYSQDLPVLNFSDIKAVKLHTGKLINVNREVESIQLAFDRNNKVDYIELLEGSVIDSYDIDKLILKKPASYKVPTDYFKKQKPDTDFLLKRVLGDGSGG